MKLSIIFFTALLVLSSCPREQNVKCANFKLEIDKLLLVQEDEKYVSHVGFDSLTVVINKNIDCIEQVNLEDLKKIFPYLQKSERRKSPYTYYMKIANIEKGELLKDLERISYTSLRFPLDSADLTVKSVIVRQYFTNEQQINSPFPASPKKE